MGGYPQASSNLFKFVIELRITGFGNNFSFFRCELISKIKYANTYEGDKGCVWYEVVLFRISDFQIHLEKSNFMLIIQIYSIMVNPTFQFGRSMNYFN